LITIEEISDIVLRIQVENPGDLHFSNPLERKCVIMQTPTKD